MPVTMALILKHLMRSISIVTTISPTAAIPLHLAPSRALLQLGPQHLTIRVVQGRNARLAEERIAGPRPIQRRNPVTRVA